MCFACACFASQLPYTILLVVITPTGVVPLACHAWQSCGVWWRVHLRAVLFVTHHAYGSEGCSFCKRSGWISPALCVDGHTMDCRWWVVNACSALQVVCSGCGVLIVATWVSEQEWRLEQALVVERLPSGNGDVALLGRSSM